MSRSISDLLSIQSQKETWRRLIFCMRYSRGQNLILACHILQNQLNFDAIDVRGLLRSVNNPVILKLSPHYEKKLLRALLESAGVSHNFFLQKKQSCKGILEQLIADWYAKYCDQTYYDSKKPALLAIFQEWMDGRKFSRIADIALLLRQKKWADMGAEERTVFEMLYGSEGRALFAPYLKQHDYDVCKNAFGERKSLYAYSSREPLDILAGQYYLEIDNALFWLVSELQCAYRDVIFPDTSCMKLYWKRSRLALSKLQEDVLHAIGPIPPDLLSEKAQKELGLTPSDLSLPPNFTQNFSADLCMHYFSTIKPFIDRCRDVALVKLSNILVFNNLEVSCNILEMIHLELAILRKQVFINDNDMLLAAKKAYDLVSLEVKVAKKVLKVYPEVGRLLYGYTVRNMALVIDYLTDLQLNKEAFLKIFPECEQIYFWQCVFSQNPIMSARLCWGLLCIACDCVKLPEAELVQQRDTTTAYKTEMHRAGLTYLVFFNMYTGGRRDAENLGPSFNRSRDAARLKIFQQEFPGRVAHSQRACSYGGGRYPSY